MSASDARGSVKKRILFVDDEPAVLASLECLLRRERARWEMVFAVGGESALASLRQGAFDAVVSDMKMPGIDGADLLGQVQRDSPATARIMLSGYADDTELSRALPTSHLILRKPCSVTELRAAIERQLYAPDDEPEV